MRLNQTFKRAIAKIFSRVIETSMLSVYKAFEKITKINLLPYTTRALKHRFGGRIIPINTAVHPSVQISTSQNIIEIAKRSGVYAIGKCYCRSYFYHNKNCKAPTDTCIYIGTPQFLNSIEKQGYASKVPFDKIEKTLIMADKVGLVHQLVYFPNPNLFYVICNCCPCCCAILSTYKKFKGIIPYFVLPSDFIAYVDESKCKNCGICVQRCPFNARVKNMKNEIKFIKENCKGCGLCATKCPNGAIKLVSRLEEKNRIIS